MAQTGARSRKLEAIQGIVVTDALEGGLIAGVILMGASMVVAAIDGRSLAEPWRNAASIVMGSRALGGPATWGIFIVGFVVHFLLSAVFGVIWGAIANRLTPWARDNFLLHGLAGIAYGFAIWVIDVRVIGLVVYPWIAQLPSLRGLLLHTLAYGLPLGWFMAMRLRPVEKRRQAARA